MTLSVDFRKSIDIKHTLVYPQPIHKCLDFQIEHNVIAVTLDTLLESIHLLTLNQVGSGDASVLIKLYTLHSLPFHKPILFLPLTLHVLQRQSPIRNESWRAIGTGPSGLRMGTRKKKNA